MKTVITKYGEEMASLGVMIPKAIMEKLDAECRSKKIGKSKVVRDILEAYYEEDGAEKKDGGNEK